MDQVCGGGAAVKSEKYLSPMEDAEMPKPTAAKEKRHPLDMQLRKRGYRIHARPNDGEPIWCKDGSIYRESDAIQIEGLG